MKTGHGTAALATLPCPVALILLLNSQLHHAMTSSGRFTCAR